MADKKFGQKRACANCEVKFYDLNKKSPITCPHCGTQVTIEDELFVNQNIQIDERSNKSQVKDEFVDLESTDTTEDDVISLDEAEIEEEQDSKS